MTRTGYFFFQSRAYGGEATIDCRSSRRVGRSEVFGVDRRAPVRRAAARQPAPPADITVSLGVGENPAKRVDGDFERELLRLLAETGASVLVDKGGDDEERAPVEAVLQPGMRTHDGAFAPFAAQIARSRSSSATIRREAMLPRHAACR